MLLFLSQVFAELNVW